MYNAERNSLCGVQVRGGGTIWGPLQERCSAACTLPRALRCRPDSHPCTVAMSQQPASHCLAAGAGPRHIGQPSTAPPHMPQSKVGASSDLKSRLADQISGTSPGTLKLPGTPDEYAAGEKVRRRGCGATFKAPPAEMAKTKKKNMDCIDEVETAEHAARDVRARVRASCCVRAPAFANHCAEVEQGAGTVLELCWVCTHHTGWRAARAGRSSACRGRAGGLNIDGSARGGWSVIRERAKGGGRASKGRPHAHASRTTHRQLTNESD